MSKLDNNALTAPLRAVQHSPLSPVVVVVVGKYGDLDTELDTAVMIL